MITIVIGLAALALMLWGLGVFTKVEPKGLALGARKAGGVIALVGAALLLFRGNLTFAVPLGLTGLGLLGWIPWQGMPSTHAPRRVPGQVSRVRSAFLEMELDHDSGAMRASSSPVHAGHHWLRSSFRRWSPCWRRSTRKAGRYSQLILIAGIAGWRERADDGADARNVRRASGKMTEEEAYQVLGVTPGASADEIGRAHRSLMKKLHPDQGGSTYLATRVNEAKDVLMRRHR